MKTAMQMAEIKKRNELKKAIEYVETRRHFDNDVPEHARRIIEVLADAYKEVNRKYCNLQQSIDDNECFFRNDL